MVMDALRINQGDASECSIVGEEPNVDITNFCDFSKDFDKPLQDGCINHSKLSVVAQVLTMKSDNGLSEAGYDRVIKCTISILPVGNRLKENFYAAKFMMKSIDV